MWHHRAKHSARIELHPQPERCARVVLADAPRDARPRFAPLLPASKAASEGAIDRAPVPATWTRSAAQKDVRITN